VGEAIQSALDQTYCHAAVIVVDDGSTDGSLDAIKSFSGKIRWQAGRNCGADAARDRVPEVRRGQSPSGRWRSDGLAGVTRALGESLAP
jgi:glycosyltransferase involved in cell wall biosynthesis